jgi:hypothetical protein
VHRVEERLPQFTGAGAEVTLRDGDPSRQADRASDNKSAAGPPSTTQHTDTVPPRIDLSGAAAGDSKALKPKVFQLEKPEVQGGDVRVAVPPPLTPDQGSSTSTHSATHSVVSAGHVAL